MSVRYLIERADGGISVMELQDKDDLDRAMMQWASCARPHEIPAKAVLPIVDEPTDELSNEFFNGWKHVGGGRVGFDMPKCREIQKAKLRVARAPMLAALDVDYQRADEAGDNKRKQDITKEKQRLRDVTDDPRIAAAQTVDELKKVWL